MLQFGQDQDQQNFCLFLSTFVTNSYVAYLGRVVLRAVVLEATVEAALLDLETRKIKKTYSSFLF